MAEFLVEPKLFKDGHPVGSRCRKCGRVFFPRKRYCSNCLKEDGMEDWLLSKKGRLISFSVAHDSLLGLGTPYVFGYIQLPEGLIVYSLLTDCEPYDERLKLGMEMEMVIEPMMKDSMDNDIVTYKFRPVR